MAIDDLPPSPESEGGDPAQSPAAAPAPTPEAVRENIPSRFTFRVEDPRGDFAWNDGMAVHEIGRLPMPKLPDYLPMPEVPDNGQ